MSSTATNGTTTDGNPASEPHAVGILRTRFAQEGRRQLDIINKLQNLGASLDFDLPQIVVIGSQSAGKSSLIESISGITLPRASGTCTRCPTECILVRSTERWQCQTSIRFYTDDNGNKLLGVKSVTFGSIIYDPKEVEDRIRRAQRAALSPSRGMANPDLFLSDTTSPNEAPLNFTDNCISLKISGPDLTDLSFCDLPGIIASVSDDRQKEDIEKVTKLVSSYISKESCIVLLTVTCETDFENQGAYTLARQFDKEGRRTIGVLTKPDRISHGETEKWIEIIKNKKIPLVHGWFCVRQPSSLDLANNMPFLEARKIGEEYFRSPPWALLDLRWKKHLGTAALTQSLSDHLLSLISRRLPELMKEFKARLVETKAELAKLPQETTRDPVVQLMHIIGNFSDEVFRHTEGFLYDIGTFKPATTVNHFEDIRKIHDAFGRRIRQTAPNFCPVNSNQPQLEVSTVADVAYESSYESVTTIVPPQVAPSPVNSSQSTAYPIIIPQGLYDSGGNPPIYLDDVLRRVQKATTRELPGYYPFHVIKDLIADSTMQWEDPTLLLIDSVYATVFGHTSALVEKHFGAYNEGNIRHTVDQLVQEFSENRKEAAIKQVKWVLELESDPFTLNQDYLDDYRRKILDRFMEQRRNLLGVHVASISKEPWNPTQNALEIMATVHAYFQVAYKRVVDNVPLTVDRELVRIKKRDFHEAIILGLEITGPDARKRCEVFLAEKREIIELRKELKIRLERLLEVQKELSAVEAILVG